MILGDTTSSVDFADYYFIELRFENSKGDCSYDSIFLSRNDVLIRLNYLLTISTEWRIDWDTSLWEEFLAGFSFPDSFYPETVVVNRMAYIDSTSVFHFFILSKEYVSTNNPELLL